jgi:3-hydroxymyristoyl/3-hydroxydecanoyl-(acyl carrier protein) dehydratase
LAPSQETRFCPDHPTAAGHFPGNPIIPGAVLLDEVLNAIAAGAVGPCAIRSAKFLQPVRPGDRVLIRWEMQSSGQAKFECLLLDPERLALTGLVQFGG